ncbi:MULTISPECIES: inorganic phosphate transporter [Halomicrobium]|uniref:Phosphate transporter n=2 Tax=Halomicrobium mukohataei TaxID=57705 RepID=C7P0K6_HALMD|nr:MULTISPECIES: inorganic phosphate transporter [Halomicrobium]ACV46988.1 phosphate transporter [Halomicrobium mukohataei DSM 12286]QCD65483.1 inorganic phosphate transporter [Halomicrobium mukohataei]QFR20289.1 inorganic phosphate transporter [Halomicrobium sp. ZPS1]
MVEVLFLVGILVAIFVGFNIGGSSTGVAFGPAVGAGTLSKFGAAALMTIFALAGGHFVGREVVKTLGSGIVSSEFTMLVSIVVLFFIGFALFLSNVVGVPASTSMTAVGAMAGLGIAQGTLNWEAMGEIVSWWLVSPVIAFWVSGVIGRYFYPALVERFAIPQTDGSLLALDRSGSVPRPVLGENTTRRELIGTLLVVGIGCYMAFAAGASNIANAVAPLVGNNSLEMTPAILLGGGAIGLGAFTIARRTMDTVGNDLTDLPLLAALLVAAVSSTIVTFLSALGVPASFVIIATMSIVGLGWGRATRTTTISDTVKGETPEVSVGALTADAPDAPTVGGQAGTPSEKHKQPIGEPEDIPKAADLFEPETTARVILTQNFVPAVATLAAYLVFKFVPIF